MYVPVYSPHLTTGLHAVYGNVKQNKPYDARKFFRGKVEEGVWNAIGKAAARDRRTALGRMAVEEVISRVGPHVSRRFFSGRNRASRPTIQRKRRTSKTRKRKISRKRKRSRKRKISRKRSRKLTRKRKPSLH